MTTPIDRLPISVVLPAYNREKLIVPALESIAKQTAQPAEVIVIDDGSSDATADVAQRAGATVVRQSNGGVSTARNEGIRRATQPWIAFLDSDDEWLPEKLALQWEAVRLCENAEIVFTDFGQLDAAGVRVGATLASYAAYRGIQKSEVAPQTYCLDLAGARDAMVFQNYVLTSTIVVRRDLLLRAGLFDPALRQREDHELLLRMILLTRGAVVERPLVMYRHNSPNSLTDEGIEMLRARSLIADRIIRSPGRYPAVALEEFSKKQPRWLRRLGVRSLQEGDFDGAVDAFSQSLARRFSTQALLWSGASRTLRALGGKHVYREARAVWKKIKGRRSD
jgi:glycosyltransferase involved in cell wall biosynthesis